MSHPPPLLSAPRGHLQADTASRTSYSQPVDVPQPLWSQTPALRSPLQAEEWESDQPKRKAPRTESGGVILRVLPGSQVAPSDAPRELPCLGAAREFLVPTVKKEWVAGSLGVLRKTCIRQSKASRKRRRLSSRNHCGHSPRRRQDCAAPTRRAARERTRTQGNERPQQTEILTQGPEGKWVHFSASRSAWRGHLPSRGGAEHPCVCAGAAATWTQQEPEAEG